MIHSSTLMSLIRGSVLTHCCIRNIKAAEKLFCTTARCLPVCAKHLIATARALNKTACVTLNHPTVVHTAHGVKEAVESEMFTLGTAKKTKYLEQTLLSPHVSYSTEGVRVSEDLLGRNQGEPHTCWERIQTDLKLRIDLGIEPLSNDEPKETWYTDGCCYKNETGSNIASWAVVRKDNRGT